MRRKNLELNKANVFQRHESCFSFQLLFCKCVAEHIHFIKYCN